MNVSDLLHQAQISQQRQDLEDAAARYRQILERFPDDPDALYGLGTVHLQARQPAAARPLLERALTLAPAAEFAYNLALTEHQLGRAAAAAERLDQAAGLGADDPELLRRIARLRAGLGDWGGAVAILQSLLAGRPDDADALRKLAQAAGKLRDYATARRAFEDYLAQTGESVGDLLAYADLLLMARQTEAAEQAIDRAMALGAAGPDALFVAARCDRLQGRYERARERLRSAVAERPEFGNAWWLLLDLEASESAWTGIADTCRRLATADSTRARDRVLLALSAGRAFEQLGDFDAAFASFRHGNEQQQALLRARNAAYDPAATERLVERLQALFGAAAPPPQPDPAPTPIFVLGLPRSGTTLVERILTGLGDVEAGGENEAMEFVASYYHWQLATGSMPPPAELDASALGVLGERYWQHTGGRPRRRTDKLPHNFRNVGLIARVFPEAPIIYLHRDPRDVALSIYSRPFPDGHPYACDLEALAHFQAQAARLHEHWQQTLPERILDVRYETLVGEPERLGRDIAAFCDLPWDPGCLDFHRRTEPSYTFSEMQVRESLNDRGVGRWRRYEGHLELYLRAAERFAP